MLTVTAEQVHSIGYDVLVDGLREAHLGPIPITGKSLLTHEAESFLTLPAWLPGRAMGVKIATVMPGNTRLNPGVPNVQAVYQLFDGASGTPAALIDGTALTYVKTAADSALGASLLAPGDAKRLLMVGAGGLSRHLVEAHRSVRPSIEQVMVWNRSTEKAEVLADELGKGSVATEDLAAAAGAADIVCCATASTAPLIKGAWLKQGTHIDLVGSFTPQMREADDDVAGLSAIFVDSRPMTVETTGDIAGPIAAGVITLQDIKADLFELCRGDHPGRASHDQITCFKNGGGGHLDLFVALLIASAYGLSL